MKLSKEKKERLKKLVLANTYLERKEALQDKWNDFSERVYLFFYQEHEKAMDMLPKGAFATQNYISFQAVDRSGNRSRNYHTIHFTRKKIEPNEVSVSHTKMHKSATYVRRRRFYDLHSPAVVREDSWIYKEFLDLKWQQDLIISDTKAIEGELDKLLASVTTKNRLLEAWPAGAEWIEKVFPDPPKNLPAVIETTKLNDLLCDAIGEKSPTCQ